MKIGLISDLHLGFRQYGSIERENDFYLQFFSVCSEMNEKNPDIVIIAGDLFNTPNPTPAAIHAYREGIKLLNADIIFSIKGNHTMVFRDNHYSIDEFFGKEALTNYYLLDDTSMSTIAATLHDDELKEKYENERVVQIDGITYRQSSSIDEFLEVQKHLASAKSLEEGYRILVVHQAFSEFCGFFGEELSISDINYGPYDLVVCGHIHSRLDLYINKDTLFIQPGSIERMNTTEAKDEEENGKGFYIVDTETNDCEFYRVECPRKFLLGDIEVDKKFSIIDFQRKLAKKTSKMKVAPIISYKFHNHLEDSGELREYILSRKEGSLLDNSSIYDELQNHDVDVEVTDSEMPTLTQMLKTRAENELNEKDSKFATDLYNLLTTESDGVDVFIEKYLEDRRPEHKKVEFKDDIEELVEYFENLGGE